ERHHHGGQERHVLEQRLEIAPSLLLTEEVAELAGQKLQSGSTFSTPARAVAPDKTPDSSGGARARTARRPLVVDLARWDPRPDRNSAACTRQPREASGICSPFGLKRRLGLQASSPRNHENHREHRNVNEAEAFPIGPEASPVHRDRGPWRTHRCSEPAPPEAA